MKKVNYNVIGVMSGTSLDGIDLVHANFKFEKSWSFKILQYQTIEYNNYWTDKLRTLVSQSLQVLQLIDTEYIQYLGETINKFIDANNIKNIDAICSHGHTALHQPEEGLTYQIGNGQEIAKLVDNMVVCDFRVQDVNLGGQGAPLVPIGDKLLFSDYDFCLNLGGFANVSLDINGKRIAYDICPVNIVLNHYVKPLGLNYDDRGALASKGNIDIRLLKALNKLDFYAKPYPKSLGLEWVQSKIIPLIDSYNLNINDILCTFCEHVSIQIAAELDVKSKAKVLITGGGVYNDFLIRRLEHHSNTELCIPDKSLIEFKEALIFGFLGILKLRDEINCLQSVTGASKDHSSGCIFHP